MNGWVGGVGVPRVNGQSFLLSSPIGRQKGQHSFDLFFFWR